MRKQNLIRSILAAESLLLVPLAAMHLSDEWDLSPADFIIIALLLAGVGFAYELITSGIRNNSGQVVIGIVLALMMVLIWVELAVGLFGSPISGN